MLQHSEITRVLLEYLGENLDHKVTVEVDAETHLVDQGILSSLKFLSFVRFLEDRFRVSLEREDYVAENLTTCSKCATLIQSKLATK